VTKARDLGLSFSINTDDPGIFECSLESEYELLTRVFGFTADDLQTIYANSLKARFQHKLRIRV
jgi:adenosine deaminase